MTKKNISIMMAVIVFTIIIGYGLGQIPMLNNKAEQYDDLLYSFEYRVNQSLHRARSYSGGISNGSRDMSSAASLFYGDVIVILGADWIELDYSAEDRELLYNYAKYSKIIYDDLATMESDEKYFDSVAFALHTKIKRVYMLEAEKDRPMSPESPNQDWTFEKGLLKMFQTDLGKQMLDDLAQYTKDHRSYDPYMSYWRQLWK